MSELMTIEQIAQKDDSFFHALLASVVKEKREQYALALPEYFRFEKELLHRPIVLHSPEFEREDHQQFATRIMGRAEITLTDLHTQLMTDGFISEGMLDAHLRYYFHKKDRTSYLLHLLYLANLYLNQARDAASYPAQIEHLFSAIDLLRMLIQQGEGSLYVRAEAMIVDILSVFPSEFEMKYKREQKICQMYFELYKIQRNYKINGFGSKDNRPLRTRIARQHVYQKNYYDAYDQFSQIAEALAIRSKKDPKVLLSLMRTHGWMGNVFQELIHYTQQGKATILHNFISQYNRAHSKHAERLLITPLQHNNAIEQRRTKKDLIRLANEHFHQILAFGEQLESLAYTLNASVLQNLVEQGVRSHLMKGIYELEGHVFESRDQLLTALCLLVTPAPNDAQMEQIWKIIITSTDNLPLLFKKRLRRHKKWIETYTDAMMQLAKNYEFLDQGDEAITYVKRGLTLLETLPISVIKDQRISALRLLKSFCQSSSMHFHRYSERDLRQLLLTANLELLGVQEEPDRQPS